MLVWKRRVKEKTGTHVCACDGPRRPVAELRHSGALLMQSQRSPHSHANIFTCPLTFNASYFALSPTNTTNAIHHI